MKRLIYVLLALLLMPLMARAVSPDDIEALGPDGRLQLVNDPSGLLDPAVKARVESRLTDLRLKTTTEVVVVIPEDIGDMEPAQWCERLFTRWKIGKEDKDNGVLVMISPGSRKAFIMTGYGMEGVLPDIACRKIIDRAIIPAMKEDDLGAAVENSVGLVAQAVSDPAVAEELRSGQAENMRGGADALDSGAILRFIGWIAALAFLVSAVVFVLAWRDARRCKTHYTKSIAWRGRMPLLFWLSIVSAGSGLVFFLLAWLSYRRWRMRSLKCPTCGAKMHRLPEDQDNEQLNAAQDLEERLDTVDWDVWKCDRCGTVERFPYRTDQKRYTECPRCHTLAYGLVGDTVVRPATTRAEGEGVRTYECLYCHYRTDRRYRIPRKADADAALVAGAVIGSAIGRGGRGGGGGGGGGFGGFGGFGGGATGGGGAGGSW